MQFVAALHGNETLPLLALQELGIEYHFGNPMASAYNKRYIDADLNASFGKSENTYESKRAKYLLDQIPNNDIVIDFHTYSSKSQPFTIVVDKDMIKIAKTAGLPVVYMKYSPKAGHSLLNHRKGISVEVGHHNDHRSYYLTQRIATNRVATNNVDVYEVYDEISTPGDYTDFVKTNDFYPILSGSKAYQNYGFKMTKLVDY